ncbi:MAG: DUF6883 domain-containing protein [Hyphomicrobiales bacterium]
MGGIEDDWWRNATIDERKIRDYLLSDTHPVGRAKARFFRQFGFERQDPELLRGALLRHVRAAGATTVETEFGTKYIVVGPLESPDGHNPLVRFHMV